MLIKYGVNPTFSHVITKHFDTFDNIFKAHADREAIGTSGNDLHHGNNSIHYHIKGTIPSDALYSESGAIDLRSRDVLESKKDIILQELKEALGSDYDIILESTHIHIEYDAK